MCFVYYLGADCDVPLTQPWSEESPAFYVSEPSDSELTVRQHLRFPCIRSLGAFTGCGCGFRNDREGFVDPDDFEPAQADHDALVAYLRSLPEQGRPMQIYGCWSGDEQLPVEHSRTCPIGDLASPDFAFRERELITLTT